VEITVVVVVTDIVVVCVTIAVVVTGIVTVCVTVAVVVTGIVMVWVTVAAVGTAVVVGAAVVAGAAVVVVAGGGTVDDGGGVVSVGVVNPAAPCWLVIGGPVEVVNVTAERLMLLNRSVPIAIAPNTEICTRLLIYRSCCP